MRSNRTIAFRRIAEAARAHLGTIARRWLPDGKREGSEWVARNPARADRNAGSFKINLDTGFWGDFSTGDKGGDVTSLAAYIFKIDQAEAARRVADMIGIDAYER